jgi:hypothetical protein
MSKKLFRFLFLAFVWVAPLVGADNPTQELLILTRLFLGEQQPQTNVQTTVNSQFVDPYSQSFDEYFKQGEQEAAKIKNIYNLAAITPLCLYKWHWDAKQPGKLANTLTLKQTTLSMQMEQLGENRFKVTIMEGPDFRIGNKELLATEFVLPPSHTTIFGFRNSESKIFFLSFHHLGTEPARHPQKYIPSSEGIITKAIPAYPQMAIDKRVQGTVILKGQFDKSGKVMPETVEIIAGHPMFNQPTLNALSELRYDPHYTPVPLKRILLVAMFRIQEGEESLADVKNEFERVKTTAAYLEQEKLRQLDEQKGEIWLIQGLAIKPNRK